MSARCRIVQFRDTLQYIFRGRKGKPDTDLARGDDVSALDIRSFKARHCKRRRRRRLQISWSHHGLRLQPGGRAQQTARWWKPSPPPAPPRATTALWKLSQERPEGLPAQGGGSDGKPGKVISGAKPEVLHPHGHRQHRRQRQAAGSTNAGKNIN